MGGEVKQEDVRLDAGTGRPGPRAAEGGRTTTYFPEPDSVPVELPAELVERLGSGLPELPAARIRRIEADPDLSRATVLVTAGSTRSGSRSSAAAATVSQPRT